MVARDNARRRSWWRGQAPAPERLHQIDFIFGSPEVTFSRAYVPKTTVSDHWPLVAKVAIR